MIYSLSHFWFWLFTIFVVGLDDLAAHEASGKNGKSRPAHLVRAGLLLGLLMPCSMCLVGRGGVWLETGLRLSRVS